MYRMKSETFFALLWSTYITAEAEYCGKLDDKEFYCEEGHCCGDFECCTYYRYYETWWFWLLWISIVLFGCTCAYYRRNHIGPYARLTSYWYSILQPTPVTRANQPTDDSPFKLPSYEEAIQIHLGPPEDNEGAPPPYVLPLEEPPDSNSGNHNPVSSQDLEDAETMPEDSTSPEHCPGVAPQYNA